MSDKQKTYWVEAPLVGKAVGSVIASSEQEAIEKFLATPFCIGDITVDDADPREYFDLEELCIHEQVNRGNVCYSPIGEAFAEEESN